MKKPGCYCTICGADITRAMKFYPYGAQGGPYCYDCSEKDRASRKPRTPDPVKKALNMYKQGFRVSIIAGETGMSMKEVYEIISEELNV